jgi:hypothetical protein
LNSIRAAPQALSCVNAAAFKVHPVRSNKRIEVGEVS